MALACHLVVLDPAIRKNYFKCVIKFIAELMKLDNGISKPAAVFAIAVAMDVVYYAVCPKALFAIVRCFRSVF